VTEGDAVWGADDEGHTEGVPVPRAVPDTVFVLRVDAEGAPLAVRQAVPVAQGVAVAGMEAEPEGEGAPEALPVGLPEAVPASD